ncbi:MAG: hypothetical protein WDA59_00155 [Methanofastidiosum sp.]
MIKEKQSLLKEKLKTIRSEVGHQNEIKQEIGREFKNRNLSAHRAVNVFMGIESLDTLSDSEKDLRFLFLFTDALNKALKDKECEINLEEYFTKLEYNKWINYQEEVESTDNIFPIVFEDVYQIAERIWQATITAQRLAELDTDNVFLYNFLTQRNPKITAAGVKIDFDKYRSFEIQGRMLSGEQYPDHIKINILNNYQEKINYNSKTKTLTIGEGSIINIFDGFHRKVANSLAVEQNPDINFTWGLIITNLSETAAKDYMIQIDKQKPIRREQIKAWDLSKKENLVVSVVADDKISKLNKVMKEQEAEVKLGKALTTKNIVATAIAENYTLDETTDIRELGKWIIEFTDYLMSLYPEEFVIGSEVDNLINHKNMFYAYIALSAKLRYNLNWKEILKKKMESINFDKENILWREMGITSNKRANKTLRNKLYRLLTEGV